jgi:glycosyltransferase involved in cell wall biosynthesis
VRFVERQPRDRIPSYLAIADVLVSPRLEGGNLPLKIFDYLATGRPIVATDVLSHRAVLTDERAVLVKPTADALARGITEVLTDDERARRLGAAARAYADHEFAWPSFVESVRELYEEAVQDGAAQHAATA